MEEADKEYLGEVQRGNMCVMKVLLDGNFKMFKRICFVLQLQSSGNMDVIDIEEWANYCLDHKTS